MDTASATSVPTRVQLRDLIDTDLPLFFEQGRDPDAVYMAAFTTKDPNDRAVFDAHWERILGRDDVTNQTILFDGEVAGNVACFPFFGEPTVAYWIGKDYWGKGIATEALTQFLRQIETRPLYARVAKDNIGSRRVLEKCGFTITGEDKGFAEGRGAEIEEYILRFNG